MNRKIRLEKETKQKVAAKEPRGERTAEFPLIQKAVARAVREYGETLKKLAKDD